MNFARRVFGLVLGRRLPKVDGTVLVAGTSAEIVIRRDGWGVPHIDAASEADAWFALGFCQGQDRSFQLETLLRLYRGTLAELVGANGVPIDRLSRRIGFRRAAVAQLDVLDPDVRANAEAFAAGVNSGVSRGSRGRAHEFVLLRSHPTEWDAADTLGMSKLMALLLPSNWDAELARLIVLRSDGPDALSALDLSYPEWEPVTSPPGKVAGPTIDALADDLNRFLTVTGAGGGSNNWVLDETRTATGRPMLANDPHLPATAPPHYYLAHIRCPAWEAAGASLVGTPGIFSGHNGVAAWGTTAGLVDNTDLCVEEIGPDGTSVRRGDTFVQCEMLREEIVVKRSRPVAEHVMVTPEGPMIGPALEGDPGAISIRATWLEPRRLRGLLELVKLRSAADFRSKLGDFPSSSQNVVFATVDGHIGWQLVGEPPKRRAGCGAFPVSGADSQAGWEDIVSFDRMPRALDPGCGWIATANAKPISDDGGPFLSTDFVDGYRMARIGERLAERKDWDLDSTGELQLDVFSIPWREIKSVILSARLTTPAGRELLRALAAWDGRLAPDSVEATMFEMLMAELARTFAEAKAPHAVDTVMGKGLSALLPANSMGLGRVRHVIQTLREQSEGWVSEPWPEAIGHAIDRVVDCLPAGWATDRAQCSWGFVRPLRFVHPAGARRPFDRVFNLGPVPGFGDANTVAQASVRSFDVTANPDLVPGLRMVIDVGRWDRCRWALPGGQSGNPCSPHYDDQFPRWQEAQGIPIPWMESEVKAAARHTLRLRSVAA